jgi:hypothetical protein
MTISMRTLAVDSFSPMLRTLSELLDKAAGHAEAKGYDVSVLLNDRLAPDMLPLWFHVQFACHQAGAFTAHLIGREAAMFERDQPTGLANLKALIALTIHTLEHLPQAAFDGAAEREVSFPLPGTLELRMKGLAFLQNWIAPQFYFHVVTTYAILRHNGVELGIQDYMSQIGGSIRQAA